LKAEDESGGHIGIHMDWER